MIYDIKSKSDLLTGASLTVTIPEEELDKKALSTILADRPGFILPFRHRSVDGQVELVYQTDSYCKLQYLAGSRTARKYADLWTNVLYPLLDCRDWFMKPYSLVLDSGCIYSDKNSGMVFYIYIPSVRDCCGYEDLREMAAEISKIITVDDANLENMVLRAIMKDFTPNGFIQMLKSYLAENHPLVHSKQKPEDTPGTLNELSRKAPPVQPFEKVTEQSHNTDSGLFYGATPEQPYRTAAGQPGIVVPAVFRDSHLPDAKQESKQEAKQRYDSTHIAPRDNTINPPDEIYINIPINGHNNNKKATGKKDEEKTRASVMADQKKTKKIGDFFSISKGKHPEPLPGVEIDNRTSEPQPLPTALYEPSDDHTDDTEFYLENAVETGFRLIGNSLLPPLIEVPIKEGGLFTIGSYDAAAGRKQSDFDFDKNTKPISRRHTAI